MSQHTNRQNIHRRISHGMASPDPHSQVRELQSTNADHLTLGSILNKSKRVFSTYVTWGFNFKKTSFHRVSFQQQCVQASLWSQAQGTVSPGRAATEPINPSVVHCSTSYIPDAKCVQVLELDLEPNETGSGEELCPPLLSWHSGTHALNAGGPHPPSHTNWRPGARILQPQRWVRSTMNLTQGNSHFRSLKSTPLHERSECRSACISVLTASCLKRSFDFRRILSCTQHLTVTQDVSQTIPF